MALAVGQAAVLNGDALAERVAKQRGDRRRQSDLGDEHQRPASGVADRGGQAEIDLGFSAARDAVQQRDPEIRDPGEGGESSKRSLLLRHQRGTDTGPTRV